MNFLTVLILALLLLRKVTESFEKTGICPCNPDIFTDEDLQLDQLNNIRSKKQDASTKEVVPTVNQPREEIRLKVIF